MKATPYELVSGQPPRQNFFPGAKGKCIMEEDVEDLLDKEEELMSGCDGSGTSGADDCGPALDGSSDDEGLAGETVSDRGNGTGGADDYGPALDGSSDDEGLAEEAVSDDGDGNGGALASTEKHKKLREEADKRYRANAEKMQLKYCKGKRKKVRVFCPGNFVSVRIPRIDRASTDRHRLPCVVVERLGKVHHLYRLR